MKKVIIVLILATIAGGFGVWYVHTAGNHHTVFKTVAVERGTLQATISATGTVEPEEVIDVGAQVLGKIKSFGKTKDGKMVDYGSQVEEGTVLARIDEALYAAQVDQAKANLQRAQADLLQMQAKVYQADRDWKRARLLGPGKNIADVDYDTARATYETAKSALGVGEAAIAQAKAALKQAEINLGYCTITSPVKGVIIDRRVNIGQTVVSSLNAPSLFLIAKDLRHIQIWASVNEADIGQIKAGQKVTFTVDAFPGQVFRGEVDMVRLNATMTQNVVTYTVVVSTDNSDNKLLPYMTANLLFEVQKRENVLKFPNAALRWIPPMEEIAPQAREAYAQSQSQHAASPGNKPPAEATKEHHDRGTLWVEDNGYVRPIQVRIGTTDGSMTEVSGDEVKEGLKVVTGEVRQSDNESTANPFTPQLFGNRQKQQ